MFKILTSDCKIREFEEKEIYMSYISLSFDCLWEIDHEVVATSCFSHKLNLVRFAKNFQESRNCLCVFIAKDKVCKHCKHLRTALNSSVKKIFVEKTLLPKDFKAENIDSYLIPKPKIQTKTSSRYNFLLLEKRKQKTC